MQVAHFTAQPGFQVCHFDNRGVHRSSAPPGPYTTELMARDALLLADDIGWSSFHIVGISMGGMISQRLALLAPERVRSLTLVATRGIGGLLKNLPTMAGVRKFVSLRRESDKAARVPKAMTLLFPDEFLDAPMPESDEQRTNREVIGEMFLNMHKEEPDTPDHGHAAQTKAAVSHHLDENDLSALKAAPFPKLIVHGEVDELIKPAHATELHKHIGGTLTIYEGVGHGFVVQAAERFNKQLEEFVCDADAKFDERANASATDKATSADADAKDDNDDESNDDAEAKDAADLE